jgi:hypothetical protein
MGGAVTAASLKLNELPAEVHTLEKSDRDTAKI